MTVGYIQKQYQREKDKMRNKYTLKTKWCNVYHIAVGQYTAR